MKNLKLFLATTLILSAAVFLIPQIGQAAGCNTVFTVASPAYGEQIIAGANYIIKWWGPIKWIESGGIIKNSPAVKIYLTCASATPEAGNGFDTITIKKSTPNDGLFKWLVPASLAGRTGCTIGISSGYREDYCGSGPVFSIVSTLQPPITVTSLNGAEIQSLTIGSTYILKWNTSVFSLSDSQTMKVSINKNDTTTCYMGGFLNNTGSFTFTLPSTINSGTCVGAVSPGTYRVSLISNDPGGKTITSENLSVVWSPFTASCSASPNPAIVNQEVMFMSSASGGTGVYVSSWSGDCSGSGMTCVKTFSSTGTYAVHLTVTSGGQTATADCSVNVTSTTQPSITVTSPNGGEAWEKNTWEMNKEYEITWTKTVTTGNTVKIELWKGEILFNTLFFATDNDGGEKWKISDNLPIGTDYRIKIISNNYPSITDTSDSRFSIVAPVGAPSIAVLSPNGGERITAGNIFSIRWQSSGNLINTTIYYISEGDYQKTIRDEPVNPGEGAKSVAYVSGSTTSYNWTVPSSLHGDYRILLTHWSEYGKAYRDYSDNYFSIVAPTTATCTSFTYSNWSVCSSSGTQTRTVVTSLPSGCTGGNPVLSQTCDYVAPTTQPSIYISYPYEGTRCLNGQICSIQWAAQEFIGKSVKIELYKGEVFSKLISSSRDNVGFKNDWTVPNDIPAGEDYKIKITSNSDASIYGISKNFKIGKIFVSYPNGGEVWRIGELRNIAFAKSIGSVKIELYKGEVFSRPITSSTSNSSINWTVPNDIPAGEDYKIKITSTSDAGVNDISDNYFSIVAPTAATCTSFTYSSWSVCSSSGTQIRTIVSSSPSGCTGGSPILSQSCTPPVLPSITVTSPNGGESRLRGTSSDIAWTKAGPTGSKVNIELWKGGVYLQTIFSSVDNNGYKSWPIPVTLAAGNDYKIKIVDTSNNSITDMSDANFSIVDRIIKNTNPQPTGVAGLFRGIINWFKELFE